MFLAFILTMPNKGSWNGQWSGEGDLYAKVVNLGRSNKGDALGARILAGQPYRHSWDDGWSASIKVGEIDAREARQLRKATKGFCGYDWMIDNIQTYGSTNKPI